MPPSDVERIAAIEDPFQLLRIATERLSAAQQEVAELSLLRRRVVQDLHAQGLSYAQIAKEAGLTRGRIHQIRHTGPAPEGAFLGRGTVTVVTPLRFDAATSRSVVALDDMRAGKRLEDLARGFGLDVTTDNVTVDGELDFNRSGLLVICGPRMSSAMRDIYDHDPVIRWDHDDKGWFLQDTRTGTVYRSGSQHEPQQPTDAAYLGRLPRPDGKGTIIAIAGIHPSGSLGVIRLLANETATLWDRVGDRRFSAVVAVEYDPTTGEPVRAEWATPLFQHEED